MCALCVTVVWRLPGPLKQNALIGQPRELDRRYLKFVNPTETHFKRSQLIRFGGFLLQGDLPPKISLTGIQLIFKRGKWNR